MHIDAEPHRGLRWIALSLALPHEQIELAQATKSFASQPPVKSGQLAHGEVEIVSGELEPAVRARRYVGLQGDRSWGRGRGARVFNKSGYARATRAAKTGFMQDSFAAALVKHSRIMGAPPFVAARVTPEMKTLLRVLAEREQITESALVRQLLEGMLRMSTQEGFPKPDTLEKVTGDARLSVRLAPDGMRDLRLVQPVSPYRRHFTSMRCHADLRSTSPP